MRSNNIFSDLREKYTRLQQNRQRTTGHAVLDAITRQETNDARSWILTFIIMTSMSLFTGYMAYKYYRFAFDPSFPGASWLMSFVMSCITEIGKIMLAYTALSAFFYGWMFKTYSKFFAGAFSLLIAGLWYYWSYNVSTEGMTLYAKEATTVSLKQDPLHLKIQEATAEIDAQRRDIVKSDSLASTMTNKRGKMLWTAQSTISTNATTLLSLQEQRAGIVKQVTDEYRRSGDAIETKTNVLADWVTQYGGFAEIICIFSLLAMIFYDKDSNEATMSSEAARKVYNKLQKNPGLKLTPEQVDRELEKAATMNGSYDGEPLGK